MLSLNILISSRQEQNYKYRRIIQKIINPFKSKDELHPVGKIPTGKLFAIFDLERTINKRRKVPKLKGKVTKVERKGSFTQISVGIYLVDF